MQAAAPAPAARPTPPPVRPVRTDALTLPVPPVSFKDAMGDLIRDQRRTQTRLSPFFSNLLPEGPLRDYLAERAGVNVVREFYLLWALGRDLPGAIIARGPDGEEPPASADDGSNVVTVDFGRKK